MFHCKRNGTKQVEDFFILTYQIKIILFILVSFSTRYNKYNYTENDLQHTFWCEQKYETT